MNNTDNDFSQRCMDICSASLIQRRDMTKICVLLLRIEEVQLVCLGQLNPEKDSIGGLRYHLCKDDEDLKKIKLRFEEQGYRVIRPTEAELEIVPSSKETFSGQQVVRRLKRLVDWKPKITS